MKKILIIEDDQLVANIYRNKFLVEGFQAEIAADGQTGLNFIRTFQPDAVILDLVLPKVSGLEVLKQLRAEPDYARLPVIVFSNLYLNSRVQEARKAGATKCLSKANCAPKYLIDAVRSTLAQDLPAPPISPAAAATSASPLQQRAAGTRSAAADADAPLRAELHRAFVGQLPATLAALRTLLQGMMKAKEEDARLKQVREMHCRIHALTGSAALTGMRSIAQMADALEALLRELYERPNQLNASTLRTVACAVDFLAVLFEHGIAPETKEPPQARILVVDDDAISCRAVTYALEKARLKSESAEDPEVAYDLIQNNKFDLIFLDVHMPCMDGHELCSKLRGLAEHKHTPVVFVTARNDFENRTRSTLSGGNDFIAKPFMFIELSVKALVHVFRARFQRRDYSTGHLTVQPG